MTLTFSETEIQALFGHEAAEDEDPERLRDYYFKTATYDHVATDLSLRILVGHKGIGKSALFAIAIAEDREQGRIAVLIKPDDIAELGTDTTDFLKTVRAWKLGLVEIIASNVLRSFGRSGAGISSKLKQFGGGVLEFLKNSFREPDNLKLDATNQHLVTQFLKNSVLTVYIDDLDRGWEGRRQDVVRISALLNAVRDLINENRGIRVRVSLRSDVYYLVRTSDESTDKIEGSVIWQTWTNHEIFVLLIKRIETFFGRTIDEQYLLKEPQRNLARYLSPVMELRFAGEGKWKNAPMHRILMSLIRKRPRDLVKLCTLAARNAREHRFEKLYTQNFREIFTEYSQGRIQDTINEFRSELADIERLILSMKPAKKERRTKVGYVYDTGQLLQKINDIRQSGEFRFANKKVATQKELAAFLYKINFLTARKETEDGIVRMYFEENRYLSNEFVDFGFAWEVHPAYRWALQPDSIDQIFASLELSAA
ncbi:MAG: hypothetical protein IH971_05400 [Candidatus Marinimicrobia bacterium]|nr:hypothetical protein [Candidatus Neomarinimicrobiota bacterium]